jgi:hypothetical protein
LGCDRNQAKGWAFGWNCVSSCGVGMLLITKIRIGALLLAAWLFVGGCNAARHPGFTMVQPKAPPKEQVSPPGLGYVELRTSTASRVRGILEMLLGGGLAFSVLWPMRRTFGRRR